MVQGMNDSIVKQWKGLPEDIQTQYGTAYHARYVQFLVDGPRNITWNPANVQNAVLNLVNPTSTVPAETLVGFDAQFCSMVMKMAPRWPQDLFWKLTRPTPAAMK